MERTITAQIKNHFETESRRPLLIKGIRGVGKTHTVCEFVDTFFERRLYINFENDIRARSFFENAPVEQSIQSLVDEYFNITGIDDSFIFVFDEVGYCKGFLNRVADNLMMIAISSEDNFDKTYSVADELLFDVLVMRPLSFGEYLMARRKEWYKEVYEGHFARKKKVPNMVHEELLELFNEYLQIGGMPDVVNEFLDKQSFDNIEERQWGCIERIFSRLSTKQKELLDAAFRQTACQNKRFKFTDIRQGCTYNMFRDELSELIDSNIVLKCDKMAVNGFCDNDVDSKQFKLFIADNGLLNAFIRRNIAMDDLLAEKILLKNYVMQALIYSKRKVGYWESEYSASIDFCFENELKEVVPIVITIGGINKNKSISAFREHFEKQECIRICEENFEIKSDILSIPLYSVDAV